MLNANNSSLSIFMTAATSSLGRETTRQLTARGHHVTGLAEGSASAALVRQAGGLPAYSDPFRAGEMKSIIHMAKADVVVHLLPQAVNCFPHKGLDWANAKHIISDSTTALLDAVRDTTVKYIVYLSSVSIYGDTYGEWVTETTDPGRDAMARIVYQAEQLVLRHPTPSAVLRAGMIYGAHDDGMTALADSVRRGRTVYMGDAHAYHNWIHEADLAQAIVLAAEQQPADQILNITDDSPASAAAFAACVADGLGVAAPSRMSAPAFALNRMTSEMQRRLMDTSLRVKNDKAKQVLGWTPRHAGFRPGIDQALMVWRTDVVTTQN